MSVAAKMLDVYTLNHSVVVVVEKGQVRQQVINFVSECQFGAQTFHPLVYPLEEIRLVVIQHSLGRRRLGKPARLVICASLVELFELLGD